MAKEEKRCKECEGKGKDECECPKKAKKGWYGLEDRDRDDEDPTMDPPGHDSEGGEGGLGEDVKMPRAPQDSDRSMKGISPEKKKKKLDDLRAAASDAKKRQSDQNRKDELYKTRKTKGIRFYDSKGSGYMKGGKKEYD